MKSMFSMLPLFCERDSINCQAKSPFEMNFLGKIRKYHNMACSGIMPGRWVRVASFLLGLLE